MTLKTARIIRAIEITSGDRVAVVTVATAVTVANIVRKEREEKEERKEGRRDQRRRDGVGLSKKASGQLVEIT